MIVGLVGQTAFIAIQPASIPEHLAVGSAADNGPALLQLCARRRVWQPNRTLFRIIVWIRMDEPGQLDSRGWHSLSNQSQQPTSPHILEHEPAPEPGRWNSQGAG